MQKQGTRRESASKNSGILKKNQYEDTTAIQQTKKYQHREKEI